MSLVKDALIAEIKELAKNAVEYKNKIDTAKTFAKREVYKKKLKKNNIKAVDVLTALETLMQREQQEAAGANNEVNDQGRPEASDGIPPSVE